MSAQQNRKISPHIQHERKRGRPISKSLEDFGQQTAILGTEYVFNRNLLSCHRIAWFMAMVLCCVCLYLTVHHSHQKFTSAPLIASSEVATPVSSVPLPSMVVCGQWAAPMGTYHLMTELEKSQNTEEERQKYLEAKAVCRHASVSELREIKNFTHLWTLMKMEVISNYSVAVFTDHDSFCIVNNAEVGGVLMEESSRFQLWYEEDLSLRNESVGTLEITTHDDFDNNCSISLKNLYLRVLPTYEFPFNFGASGQQITRGRRNVQTVDVELMDAEEDEVRVLPLRMRGCYFRDERRLEYFRVYTQDNCRTECLVNTVIRKHGCTPSVLVGPVDVPLCEDRHDEYEPGTLTSEPCDCVAACSEVKFLLSNFQTFVDKRNATTITVEFKRPGLSPKVRRAKSTYTHYLASCAGFMVVLLGASVMSVLEVLYHVFSSLFLVKSKNEEQEDLDSTFEQLQALEGQLVMEVANIRKLLVDKIEITPHETFY